MPVLVPILDRIKFVAVCAIAFGLIHASAAYAGTVTLSAIQPTPDSTITSVWTYVGVHATSTVDIPMPQTILIDGAPVTASGYYAEASGHYEWDEYEEMDVWVVDTYDYTDITLYCYVPNMVDGPHAASISVVDSQGGSASRSWSFTVAQKPSIWSAYPSQYATSTLPAVRVPFSDNAGTHTCVLTVDGRVVPTSQVGNEFRGTVDQPLTDGALVNASATVTDQGGRSTTFNWTFRVVSPDLMTAVMTPASGVTVGAYPAVTCTAYSPIYISYMDFVFDDRLPARVYPTMLDSTHWKGTFYPNPPVPTDGPHTVTCTVTDVAGNKVAFSTTFIVNQPPTVYASTPAPQSRVTGSPAQIAAYWYDNSSVAPTAVMKVDGIVVPHIVAGPYVKYVPTVPLADEATHTVWVSVTDAAGNEVWTTWSFWVDRYPMMPVNACTACHSTYPAVHVSTSCFDCHGIPHGDTDCENCHDDHDFSACAGCHTSQVTYAHESTTGWPHVSTTPFAECRECHTSSLAREHNRYVDGLGVTLDCLTCHAATAPALVKNAVALGDTRCEACHDDANHLATHISPTSATCFGTGCHPASKNLTDVHAPYTGEGSERPQFANACQLCHDNPSVDPSVSDMACTGTCHVLATHSGMSALHATTSASAWCTSSCHDADINEVHGAYADLTRCGWCHDRRDNWTKTGDCTFCHGAHPHPDAGIDGVLANEQRLCTDCHSADVVAEHAKSTSRNNGTLCETCHAVVGAPTQTGQWDTTCADDGCHSPGSNRAVHENYCLGCHEVGNPDFATAESEVDFSYAPVNREVACKSCHVPGLVGTHPYHQIGANCAAACHPTWGPGLLSATPAYMDPTSGASFASVLSKTATAEQLHAIHSLPRWPAGVSTPQSECASCHSVVACNACHSGSAPVGHKTHSGTNQVANPPWTGVMGRGVVDGDQTQRTAVLVESQCGSAGCHNVARMVEHRPTAIEDFNHAIGGNPDEPTAVNSAISTVGNWRPRYNTRYTGGRMSYSAAVESSISASFTGARVEVVGDVDPYRGRGEVLLDGVVIGTFDAYAALTKSQVVLYTADVEPGAHTISVRPIGSGSTEARAAFVAVDTFRVYREAVSLIPQCSSCHADKVADHAP